MSDVVNHFPFVTWDAMEPFDHHTTAWGRVVYEGVCYRKFFPNGRGVSVVRHCYSYGYERGLWELAVLAGTPGDWQIDYSTTLTRDVLSYLEPDDVFRLLAEVEMLPVAGGVE